MEGVLGALFVVGMILALIAFLAVAAEVWARRWHRNGPDLAARLSAPPPGNGRREVVHDEDPSEVA